MEITRNPKRATRNTQPVTLNFTGPSMKPTLKPGDGLGVHPYGDRKIRIGDVVVACPPEREQHVVHRVVSVDSHGIRTRGDNNNNTDAWVLCAENIIGQVVGANRKNKNKTIYGGRPGRIYASGLKAIKQIDWTVSRILHPVYHRLASSGIFRNLLPLQLKTHVLCFKRANGIEMQLLMGRWVIGRRLNGQDRWHIRRPFRLFVDEHSLPEAQNILRNPMKSS
jgi:signal peptidase I